ncbi:hypothetical protein TALC_01214 [Thermoplasmatales archaeon BRNA1]|nr:hypothetical protein TALC_01214 [Thermoplasmatales archaeon BRNA1]
MAMIGGSGFMAKEFGPITYGQLIGISIAFLIGLVVLVSMGGNILGWMIAAVLLFFIPHLFGAGPKTRVVYGAAFFGFALVIGGALVNPAAIDALDDTEADAEGSFGAVSISYDGTGGLTITSSWSTDKDHSANKAYAVVDGMSRIVFGGIYLDSTLNKAPVYEMTGTTALTCNVPAGDLDMDKIYYIVLVEYHQNESGDWVQDLDTKSNALCTGAYFTGSESTMAWYGAAYGLAYTMAIFYFLVLATWFMRHRLLKTRKKMEAQGRLYPQGYGRCTFCGSIVLPGEVECRKCGAYIDRPESMKKQKHDMFQCTNCGAEVPGNADVCPKCGAKFDGVENEVQHIDGTVDVSDESVECPFCGAVVPANADHCPKCFKKLRE